jgi:OOP family OmpA-OmpF porin
MEQITSYSKISCLIITMLFLLYNCKSQNLIRNSSFEEKGKNDLAFILNKKICKDWYSPTKGTPDYFSVGSNSLYNVPNNMWGNQAAQSGNSYVGIVTNYYNYEYEYLQTKLTSPLKANTKYCLSFYISLSDKSDFSINEIQFALTKQKIKQKEKKMFKYNAVEHIVSPLFFKEKEKWVRVCALYIAKNQEEYLTLGLFTNDYKFDEIANKKSKKKFDGVYYYIDDISLIEIKDSAECNCKEILPIKDSIKVDSVKSVGQYDEALASSIILKNINFETDKSNLLQSSCKELNKLVKYLMQNPSFNIEISGYTDNTGKEKDNIKLSEERAKAVVNYLIQNGISEKRASYKGYGSKKPTVPNDTEENKAKNRRVEFKISR